MMSSTPPNTWMARLWRQGGKGREVVALERRIKKITHAYPMRVIGPNCLGVIRPSVGLNASFLEVEPAKGDIALISPHASTPNIQEGHIAMGHAFCLIVERALFPQARTPRSAAPAKRRARSISSKR